ncbi:pilus assembly protein TadG-related protein [Acetobacter sp. UBA5411]|uniref:pilus assembly protein TadG-related protein n=1 Tax=Acetobacter sp. UBA5411 TaxID=1945905 RepID=UPI0025C5BD25|nr:pilus assembly protein TadG-related protein [Acetobacter sp. UBA5411]
MLRKILFRQFLSNQAGGVIIFAVFGSLVIMTAIAAAVDYSQMVATKTKLQNFSDSAALSATKIASNYMFSHMGDSNAQAAAQQIAETTAIQSVTQNAQIAGISPVPTVTVQYTSTSSISGTVSVSLSYTSNMFIANLLKYSGYPITVKSTATMDEGETYFQIIFIVDISNSMAIGGDPTAISTLEDGSSQCVFACHDPNGYGMSTEACYASGTRKSSSRTWPCDMRTYAKQQGINLKIDYVNQALEEFMESMSEYSSNYPDKISISINTIGTNFNQILSSTTDMTAAINAASSIDVENATQWSNSSNNGISPYDYKDYNYGYTNTSDYLNKSLSLIENIGDGTSPTERKTYVIFLSDGAQDVWDGDTDESNDPDTRHRIVSVDYSDACQSIKQSGIKLFSVWATYYSINDYMINPLLGTGSGSMQGAMQACASDADDFFEADDGPAIQSAITSIFSSIMSDVSLRLIGNNQN